MCTSFTKGTQLVKNVTPDSKRGSGLNFCFHLPPGICSIPAYVLVRLICALTKPSTSQLVLTVGSAPLRWLGQDTKFLQYALDIGGNI